jgi:hypothetical protein
MAHYGFGFQPTKCIPLDAPTSPDAGANSDADAGLFAAPSSHYTVRSRSLQPSPVGRSTALAQPVTTDGASRGRSGKRPPQGRNNQPTKITSMTYIQQFEAELLKKLNGTEEEAVIVRWVSEIILESYRNGITAGQKGVQVIRKGQSRRRGFPPAQ